MPEMPDVVAGETIESEWGNDIRDRTVQRYANVAERTSLNASPTVGDVSYLENSGQVDIYHAGSWRPVAGTEMVRVGVRDAGPNPIASTEGPEKSQNITIPTTWNNYDLFVWLSFDLFESGTLGAVRSVTSRIRYPSSAGPGIGNTVTQIGPDSPNRLSVSFNGMSMGETITGTQIIVYTAEISADSGAVSWANLTLTAIAYRNT